MVCPPQYIETDIVRVASHRPRSYKIHASGTGRVRGKARICLCNVPRREFRRFPEPWVALNGLSEHFGLVDVAGKGTRDGPTLVRVPRDHA